MHVGHLVVYGFQVEIYFPVHNIVIYIYNQIGYICVVHFSQLAPKEKKLYGLQLRSDLFHSIFRHLYLFGDVRNMDILCHAPIGREVQL